MQISLFVAGKARIGPERDLTERFVDRISRSGTSEGLGPTVVKEYDPSQRMPNWLSAAVLRRRTALCIMDESGRLETSADFAAVLSRWRDIGRTEAAFLIGGPNGVPVPLVDSADRRISFGRMTFPHMIARVLLAEQIYRAISILRGEPYLRE